MTTLATKFVFLDTQAFVAQGLNLNSATLKAFCELCRKKEFFHITTTVVTKEVEEKIRESIHEGLLALRTFRTKSSILSGVKNANLQALFSDVDDQEVISSSLDVFGEFLRETGATVLDIQAVNAEKVMERYFARIAPFGEGRKKVEFPDAFSLLTLEAFAKEKGVSIYVVSGDGDLERFCSGHKQLIRIASLDRLLDLYNSHQTTLSDLVKEYIAEHISEVGERIQDKMEDSGGYNEGGWEDSEVEDLSVEVIDTFELSLVSVNDSYALLTFDFDADVSATVTGKLKQEGYYDDFAYRPWRRERKRYSRSQTFTAEVELTYDYVDGDLRNCEIEGVSIAGTRWGVPVHVDEAD